MRSIKRTLLSLTTLLLISGVASAAPLPPRHASADESTGAQTSDTASNDTVEQQDGNKLAEEFRQAAQAKLEAARANRQEHTQQQREQACSARKTNLTKRMASAVAQAKRHKLVMDGFYTKIKAFYVSKNLSVSNYPTLTAAVDTAQTNAQASIDALATLDVNVDCTSQTVAASISAFQTAESNTRDSLKSYRQALVDLITALKGASTGATQTGDNSTNSTNQ